VNELDDAILQMIDADGPVLFDCMVSKDANCFPMIPSGAAHNSMLLGDEEQDLNEAVSEKGKVLV